MAAIKQAALSIRLFSFSPAAKLSQKCDPVKDRKIFVLSLSCLPYPDFN